jgi:hypothetical protein
LPAWLPLLVVLVAAVVWWRFGRRELTATRAYLRLRGRLRALDPELGPAVAPLALARRLGDRFPAAERAVGSLVGLYLRESFGNEQLGQEELQRARLLMKRVFGVLRKKRRYPLVSGQRLDNF